MKKAKKYFFYILVFVFLYTGSYCALRLTKYFVRQEFVTFTCSKEIQQKYPSDTDPVVEGHVSYEFESYRNQIGYGRIQERETRFAERFSRPVFYPIAELEMRIRGFNSSTMRVLKYVAELERYTSDGKKYILEDNRWLMNLLLIEKSRHSKNQLLYPEIILLNPTKFIHSHRLIPNHLKEFHFV